MGSGGSFSSGFINPLEVRAEGTDRSLPPGPVYRVGRDPGSDIVIQDSRVSWEHAVLRVEDGSWVLADNGSTNGTYAGGQRVSRLEIAGEHTIRLGHPADGALLRCSVSVPAPVPAAAPAAPPVAHQAAAPAPPSMGQRPPSMVRRLPARVLRIGRNPDNDVVVPDLSVSRYHAELRNIDGAFQIADLGSYNGTFVNGQQVTLAPVTERDVIGIGTSTFRLSGTELQEFADTGDISMAAKDLTVRLPSGKVLLDHVSFPLGERCLLAIIGPSGAGKSTLLGALTGMRPATDGSVLYDDRDLYSNYAELRHRIGLVPQEDILHTQLTARRALRYAAELRFPRDTSRAERNRRVDEVLAELSLTKHAETRADRLSGGQQKRVNVALELMTKPSLLFLDEPTSGLDPGLDKSVMEMMAGLAHDGRTIIVVTHSVANLNVCDRLLVLVPGGRIAYFGPPSDGLRHFGKPGWAEVFQAFETEPDRDWAGEFRRSPWYAQYIAAGLDGRGPVPGQRQVPPPPQAKNRVAQFSTLSRRYVSVIASDKVYLGLLAGAPVVLGGMILVIPDKNGLTLPPQPAQHGKTSHHASATGAHHASATPNPAASGHATRPSGHATASTAVQHSPPAASHAPPSNPDVSSLLLILIVGACFAGAFNAVRELVKERAIYSRERAAGLSSGAYLASKLAVLGVISALQAVVLVLIGLSTRKMPPHGVFITASPLAEVIVAMAVLAIVSMSLGLLISASVNSSEKTMPILMVLVVVEVVLTGGIFTIAGKVGVEQISWLSPSRWGFAAVAATANLNKLIPPAPGSALDTLWRHSAGTWLLDMGALLLLGIIFAVITWWRLVRQGPRRRAG